MAKISYNTELFCAQTTRNRWALELEGGQINPKWLTAVNFSDGDFFLASNVIRMCFHRKVNMTVLLGRSLTAFY